MLVTELARGLWTTFRTMFEKPVTFQYPEVKRPVRERFRGRHELKRFDNGLEKCIGCALCAAACPADAIFVEAAENTDAVRYSPGRRDRRPDADDAGPVRQSAPGDAGPGLIHGARHPMTPDLILFLGLAVLAIASAVAMLAGRNAVYSALFLGLNLVTGALLSLLLNAAFIAMVQITVYAGALMVLF